MADKQKRIHVVINPASGKDEPIINVINRVFNEHDIDWSISVTKKFGDATAFAKQAAEEGYDIVAGYGGDGTQHEIANGILGTKARMGVLPGGTGNGFANEMGTPVKLAPALELLCTSDNLRHVDAVQMDRGHFIQRLYVGTEPEQQTSREDKDKYGTFAYAINSYHQAKETKEVNYTITLDDKTFEFKAMKVYVVNAAKAGTGISVTGGFSSSDDGLVDVFLLNLKQMQTISGAVNRMLNLDTKNARDFIRRASEVSIDTDPDQPIWTDGEYVGRTPVSMKVLPGALPVVVP